MTDDERERIRGIAGELREAGVRVTSRSVYGKLGNKGAYLDVFKVVTDWRVEVDYQPEIELHDLPMALKVRLLNVGKNILEQVRAEETAKADAVRAEADARRRVYETETVEATAMVAQMMDRVRDLQAEVAYLRALTGFEGIVPPESVEPAPETTLRPAQADEADDLWARVDREVRAMLAERGPMWETEILDALPIDVRRGSARVGLPLFGGWLGFHLRRMAGAGDGITLDDGRFAVSPAPVRDEPVPGRNVEATRFWRLVMLEVVAIIRRKGAPMTVTAIVPELAPNTLETAKRFEKIKPGMLAEKMRFRASIVDPYFVDLGDGSFDLSAERKAQRPAA